MKPEKISAQEIFDEFYGSRDEDGGIAVWLGDEMAVARSASKTMDGNIWITFDVYPNDRTLLFKKTKKFTII